MKTPLFILPALLAFAPALSAQTMDTTMGGSRWVAVYSDREVTISIDQLTYRRERGGIYRVWSEWRYTEALVSDDGERYDTTTRLDDIDCAQRRSRLRGGAWTYRRASVASFMLPENEMEWAEPIPETFGEALLDGFCFWVGDAPR